jgi:ABC-type phosphate transport system substrate-binding protein
MTKIAIQPADRLEIVGEDVEPLAEALRAEGYEVEVTERRRVGYGVTWWEVFHIFIEEAEGHAIDAAVGAAIAAFANWARNRFKKGKNRREEMAPKHATIYGPDGEALKEVTVERGKRRKISDPEKRR